MARTSTRPLLSCLFTLSLVGSLPACSDDADEGSGTANPESTETAGDGDGDATGDGDGDATGDGDGDATGDGDGDSAGLFQPVLTILEEAGCTSDYCHGSAAGGLEMTNLDTAYANLVDIDAVTPACGQQKRVVPGEPEQSILWLRVRPVAMDMGMACVEKMPQGSEGLDEASAQIIYDWIIEGALP